MEHKELTHKVIEACMKIHRVLGRGFPEIIYQRAVAIELVNIGLSFKREMEMDIFYEGICIGKRRVDFFIEEKILLELKAVGALDDGHIAQTMNYCQAYNLPTGLLINFGSGSLEYKRVYNIHHKNNKPNPKIPVS